MVNTAQRWQAILTQTDWLVYSGNLDLNKLPALQTIVFANSRMQTEAILPYLQQRRPENLRDFVSRRRRARKRLLLGQKWLADWG